MTPFPNKAGDHADTDDILTAELKAAGIRPWNGEPINDHFKELFRQNSGEVKTSVVGFLHGWEFNRAWYYWMAKGPGIDVDTAEALHKDFGREVRVAGHGGAPSPREHFKGLACGSYHVDSAEGLKALADCIRGLVAKSLAFEQTHKNQLLLPQQKISDSLKQEDAEWVSESS